MKTKSNLSVAKIALAAVAVGLAVSAHAAYVNFTNNQAVGSVKLSDLTNAVNCHLGKRLVSCNQNFHIPI